MSSWFSKKTFPEYWENYLSQFKTPLPKTIKENRFVVIDTETTGFHLDLDRILCIGAVIVENLEIKVAQGMEVYVQQDKFNPETVQIHGILRNERIRTYSEEETLKLFLDFIGNSILVAHHAEFDIGMINSALNRRGLPNLKNKVIDTVNMYRATQIKSNLIYRRKIYKLDDIAYDYGIDLSDRHTAAGDAFITALIFLRTLNKLMAKPKFDLIKLLKL